MSWIFKQTNSPYWYYGWRDDGGDNHCHVLTPKTTNRVEAETLQKIEDRKQGAAVTGEVVTGVPWAHFKPEFLKEYRGKTLKIYKNSFRLFEALSNISTVSSFTYNDAKAFKADLRTYESPQTERILKDNSVNITLRNMRTAWGEAVRMKYAAANVFEEVKQVEATKRIPRYLQKEQVKTLKETARKSEHPDLYLMLLFLLYTGIRKQELINLKWSAIDLQRGVMYLHGSEGFEPKDREEHAIGLHKEILNGLKRRESREDYIFTGKAGKRSESATGHLFNRLYARAAG